jgi:hypothetical protein
MEKKYLIFGMAVILGASLSFFACESATGAAGAAGEPGEPGEPGSVFINGSVTAAQLAKAFEKANEVVLQDGVISVYGTVPAGKALVVFGSTTKVFAGQSLDVQGTLEIAEGAALDASYVSGAAGYLKSTGTVTGEGTVALPYIKADASNPPDGIVTFDSSLGEGIVKSAGSYITGSAATPGGALDNAGIIETISSACRFFKSLSICSVLRRLTSLSSGWSAPNSALIMVISAPLEMPPIISLKERSNMSVMSVSSGDLGIGYVTRKSPAWEAGVSEGWGKLRMSRRKAAASWLGERAGK